MINLGKDKAFLRMDGEDEDRVNMNGSPSVIFTIRQPAEG